MKDGEGLWPLDELTNRVAAALAEGYEGAASGRVRDIPDRRTIRYYTTLGLIDRPAEMRGRTALYSPRHLLQLVAIKKLQAAGRALAEIQSALAGQTDAELARIAAQDAAAPANGASPPDRRDSWCEEPAAPPLSAEEAVAKPSEQVPPQPQVLCGIPLHSAVTLLLAPARPMAAEDLEAIQRAAVPLMDLLTRSRLIEPRERGDPS